MTTGSDATDCSTSYVPLREYGCESPSFTLLRFVPAYHLIFLLLLLLLLLLLSHVHKLNCLSQRQTQ
jgi:hypothetical protein